MTAPARTLRVAVAQYQPRIGDPEGNRTAAVAWVEAAAAEGAQLVVLPELASSGYVFSGEEEAAALAEDADSGVTVAALVEVCRRRGLHVVAGLAEQGDGCRHNSAVVLGPAGRLATYRKLHLFYDEQSWFRPGEELVVVDLPTARVGVAICYDLWFPEVARALALRGAEVIAGRPIGSPPSGGASTTSTGTARATSWRWPRRPPTGPPSPAPTGWGRSEG